MQVQLSPSLVLSDEDAACERGAPVLILSDGRTNKRAFGARDLVKFGYATQPAAAWVRRLGVIKSDPAERQLCEHFLQSWPEGPQLG